MRMHTRTHVGTHIQERAGSLHKYAKTEVLEKKIKEKLRRQGSTPYIN